MLKLTLTALCVDTSIEPLSIRTFQPYMLRGTVRTSFRDTYCIIPPSPSRHTSLDMHPHSTTSLVLLLQWWPFLTNFQHQTSFITTATHSKTGPSSFLPALKHLTFSVPEPGHWSDLTVAWMLVSASLLLTPLPLVITCTPACAACGVCSQHSAALRHRMYTRLCTRCCTQHWLACPPGQQCICLTFACLLLHPKLHITQFTSIHATGSPSIAAAVHASCKPCSSMLQALVPSGSLPSTKSGFASNCITRIVLASQHASY